MRILTKVLKATIITIVALCLLVVVALQVALNTPVRDKIIHRLVTEYTDMDIGYSDLYLSLLKSFPTIGVDVAGLHVDSLLTADSVRIRANAKEYLKDKVIHVEEIHIKSPVVNYVASPQADKDTTESAPFSLAGLPHIILDTLLIDGHPRVRYASEADKLDISVDASVLGLKAECDSAILSAGLLVDTLHTDYIADVVLSLTADCVGPLDLGKKEFPKVNVNLSSLEAEMDGLKAALSAIAKDVLGKDPYFKGNLSANASLDALVKYCPPEMGLSGSGDLDLDLDAAFRMSQLNAANINKTDIQATLTGGRLYLDDSRDSIEAFLSRPRLSLRTMRNLMDTTATDKVLGMTFQLDSMDVDLWNSMCIRGRNLALRAQDGDLNTTNFAIDNLPPVIARLDADFLHMKGADSLEVDVRGTKNSIHIVREEVNDAVAPKMSLSSESGSIIMRAAESRFAVRGMAIKANAGQFARRQMRPRMMVQRPDSLLSRDSSRTVRLSVPDFMSEADFRRSDLDFRLDSMIVQYVRKWNPSGSVTFTSGTAYTPIYPLRNRINGFGMRFDPNAVYVDSLNLVSGTSDISLTGDVRGLRTAMVSSRGMLSVNAALKSDKINVNEVMAALDLGQGYITDEFLEGDDDQYIENASIDSLVVDEIVAPLNYSLIVVPANISAGVSIDLGEVDYSNIKVDKVSADLAVRERCVQLTDLNALTQLGTIGLDGFYSTRTKQDISAGFNLGLQGITADNVIAMFPVVDEVIPMLKTFGGKLNCEMAATTQLDTNMNFILPSLDGVMKIHGSDLSLNDLSGFKNVTRLLMFKDKEVGHINDMEVMGIINDSQLEIFPFLLNLDRYSLALKGLQKFDNSFDYHISVIKSPIPFKFGINVYGKSFDKWKFRLCRAQYKSTKIPLFNDEVETMQLNLITSIKNVFKRGVNAVLRENAIAGKALEAVKQERDAQEEGDDELTVQEELAIDSKVAEFEAEEELEAVEEEIAAELEGIEIVIPD